MMAAPITANRHRMLIKTKTNENQSVEHVLLFHFDNSLSFLHILVHELGNLNVQNAVLDACFDLVLFCVFRKNESLMEFRICKFLPDISSFLFLGSLTLS